MKKITQEELKVILENHKHWLYMDCDGWKNMKADLKDADLCDANLHSVDLRYANLYGVNLCNADLECANLEGVNLGYANLEGANLKGTKLKYADLGHANLNDTILEGAKNIPYLPMVCAEYGSFIGFKKANNKIIMLEILNYAKRLSGTSRGWICDKAKVLEIQELNGDKTDLKEINSDCDESFTYKVGEIIKVQDFDEDGCNQCSTGIHFFMSRQEAVEYDPM